jgi:Rrf2 family protein
MISQDFWEGASAVRLSTVGRYALRAMVDLALHGDQGPVPRKDVAGRQNVSEQYLAQLFLRLKRAGLVESVRGPGGGYALTRHADEISAGDVLRAVDESLEPVFCVEDGQGTACQRADGCPTHWLWGRLGTAITQVLDSVTLAELCARTPDAPDRVLSFAEGQSGAASRQSGRIEAAAASIEE